MFHISIIIPVYNVEQYLRQCIDSVLNQTLTDFELILVDDGSPDNCGAICDEYAAKDNRVSVIHQNNRGSASARSTGLVIASGEYIAFLDSDDWVDAHAYEALYSIAEANNKPDVIMYRSYEEGSEYYIPKTGYYNRQQMEQEILPHLMPHFDDLGKSRYLRFSNCMKIYKRSFLQEAGICYHDGILIMEDVIFSFDCIDRAQSFYYSDQALYHVTVNPNSLSRTPYSKNKTQSMLLIAQYIREYQQRSAGYDYGDHIHSAVLFFLEAGIANELKAPTHKKCLQGIRKIRNSEMCKWYLQQQTAIVPGWYGKVQRNLRECSALGIAYRMKYRPKLRKWKSALLHSGTQPER